MVAQVLDRSYCVSSPWVLRLRTDQDTPDSAWTEDPGRVDLTPDSPRVGGDDRAKGTDTVGGLLLKLACSMSRTLARRSARRACDGDLVSTATDDRMCDHLRVMSVSIETARDFTFRSGTQC